MLCSWFVQFQFIRNLSGMLPRKFRVIAQTFHCNHELCVTPRSRASIGVIRFASEGASTSIQKPQQINEKAEPRKEKRFADLFRRSKFVQLGDFEGRIVIGEIVRRLNDDLYIDMGLKFNAVCTAPAVKNERYKIGAKVLLRLHDTELSELFLGSTKELTLLEADATLLGLYNARSGESKRFGVSSIIREAAEKARTSLAELSSKREEVKEAITDTANKSSAT